MRHPWTTKALAFAALFSLAIPASAWAADDATTATATPAASKASHKHHHKNKHKSSDGVTHTNTVAPVTTSGSDAAQANVNAAVSGVSDRSGTNNPGTPNMGSPDHVPGTTGTSGQ